ncbi:hypothetical protein BC834DRAFT_853891 [Gloeopeniophorella convolvens]|nr:hypothetical protein BC834DRAFT_853891 [Gloeopeniophorella convolvens]
MNAVAGPSSRPAPVLQTQPAAPPWEFTRRKRWADLLITELTEAIVLVLSPTCKVLFCNPAVRDILAWQDEDMIDKDLTELVNVNDRLSFCTAYSRSIEHREDLHVYARLRCKPEISFSRIPLNPPTPPREVLLEVTGYPHFMPGENACKCFFAVAKPYPSRNTAMLNTLLELKVENERLQQRLGTLRARSQQLSVMQGVQQIGSYTGEDMTAHFTTNIGFPTQALSGDPTRSYYPVAAHDIGGYLGYTPADDDTDAEPRRKKPKKALGGEQYICNTCGRTDSPEWRKGPRGPKTLCNACGLRWAKKVRRFEEAAEAGDTSQQPLDDTVPP